MVALDETTNQQILTIPFAHHGLRLSIRYCTKLELLVIVLACMFVLQFAGHRYLALVLWGDQLMQYIYMSTAWIDLRRLFTAASGSRALESFTWKCRRL